MNLFNFLNIQNSWNLDPLKGEILKDKLNEFLTHELDEIGLSNWNKDYQWSGDFNATGIKHVVEFVTLKDNSATLHFGNVYNFIPILSVDGKILSKSKRLQLYERIEAWNPSSHKKSTSNVFKISLWND